MSYVLSVEMGSQLNEAIADVVVQAEASRAILTDEGGNILACSPEPDGADHEVQTVAALAAGSFAANCELARLCDETAFRAVSHEGEQTSLFVQAIGEHHLLVVIFERTTTLGLVKLYAGKAARELQQRLTERPTASPSHPTAFELSTQGNIF